MHFRTRGFDPRAARVFDFLLLFIGLLATVWLCLDLVATSSVWPHVDAKPGARAIDPRWSLWSCAALLSIIGALVTAAVRLATARRDGEERSRCAVTAHSVETTVADRQPFDAELRQRQEMDGLGELAGWVAHEFNNVLQVILGYTAIAADPDTDPAEQAAALRRVHDAADAGAQLTGQLLALGGRQPLQLRDTDLADTARHLLPMMRRLAGERIDTRCITADRVANVRCDRVQIEQVLLTLCADALDAMPGGGRLTLSVDEVRIDATAETQGWTGPGSGQFVRLRVADTRIPMSADARSRIFEPLRSARYGGRGTGLGLAIARGIVGGHGGVLDVDSNAGGTTFTILLPAATANPGIDG